MLQWLRAYFVKAGHSRLIFAGTVDAAKLKLVMPQLCALMLRSVVSCCSVSWTAVAVACHSSCATAG